MKKEKLMPEKLYDTDTLTQTHEADAVFIKFMVSLFVRHMPETNACLELAYKEKDWEHVFFFAHKLKASIDLFNLEQLKDPIRSIEQKAKSQQHTDTIAGDVVLVSNYLHRCVAAMKNEFNLS